MDNPRLTTAVLDAAGVGAFFRPRDVLPLGVSFRQLQRFVAEGTVEKLGGGVYRRSEVEPTVQWFEAGNKLLLSDTASAEECVMLLDAVPELIDSTLVPLEFDKGEKAKLVSACEFVLEGLYAQNKISRNEDGGFEAVTKAKRDRRGMIYEDFTDVEGYN